jgi:hypothetical protein
MSTLCALALTKNQIFTAPNSSHYCHHSNVFIFIFALFLSEGRVGEAWEPSNKPMLYSFSKCLKQAQAKAIPLQAWTDP